MKLFLKGNEKLTTALAIGVLSILVLSMALSPTFNLLVKAQGQNETRMSQGVQEQLTQIAEKVKDLAAKAGFNATIQQGGNLSEKLQQLADSAPFKNLSQQLSQQLSQIGINGSNIQSLKQEAGSDFSGLIQKLQNLTSSRSA